MKEQLSRWKKEKTMVLVKKTNGEMRENCIIYNFDELGITVRIKSDSKLSNLVIPWTSIIEIISDIPNVTIPDVSE